MSKIVKGKKVTNIQEIEKIATVMNISIDELIQRKTEMNVIEDPVLFMMDQTNDSKTRQHLQYLGFIMDEMIELEELAQTVRRHKC